MADDIHPGIEFIEERMDEGKMSEEDAMLIIYLISDQQSSASGVSPVGNYIARLKQRGNESATKAYLDRVLVDAKGTENTQNFKDDTERIIDGIIAVNGAGALARKSEYPFIDQNKIKTAMVSTVALMSNKKFVTYLLKIADKNFAHYMKIMERCNTAVLKLTGGEVALLRPQVGTVVTVRIVAAYLTYDALKNLWDWWKGRISGKRCASNIVKSVLAQLGSVAGGAGGAIAGAAVAGPAGIIVGSVAGMLIGHHIADKLTDKLTSSFFDLPKTDALEKAYNFLGVHHTASNGDINSAFRKLALKYHPDKSEGMEEEWIKLQSSLQIIRMSRAE